MRVVVQRVRRASVTVAGRETGAIGQGLLVLVGVVPADGEAEVGWIARKLAGLRVFENEGGKLDLSVRDVGGEVLVVSQFTLLGDCSKGRRPSFTGAAPPERARPLVDTLAAALRAEGIPTACGEFGAHMQVELINDGPVTLVLDTPQRT